jgi:cation diffusion facilitator CzcD-associated flavoprotein CzcO
MRHGVRRPRVAIVGGGMSGLLMGIRLVQAGFRDFVIYEKAQAIGGTWRDNRYPGLACDIPSRYYSFSFAPNPSWSQFFSPGGEILAYLESMVDQYGLRQHIRLGTPVESAEFADGGWRVRTESGEPDEYDFVVSACGILHHPRLPAIEGLDTFGGEAFHTARWPSGLQLAGKRVGIIGNGSTGVQVGSAIAPEVGHLSLFQRTPQWIFPLPNGRYGPVGRSIVGRSRMLSRLAYIFYQRVYEFLLTRGMVEAGWQRRLISWVTRQHLRVVRDHELRRKLTPDYAPMCKRIIVSTQFYPAMNRDNVALVTESIARVTPTGVVTADGATHELDILVLATGFDAHAFMRPMELVGEDGLTLSQAWQTDPRAYQTVALPGFPNFFMLVGPHSPYGNQSVITIAETQADYVLQWIQLWARGEVDRMAPTREATARFNAAVRDALPGTIWTTGCDSWYLDSEGLPELWPWIPRRHRELLRNPNLADFEIVRGPVMEHEPHVVVGR